MLNAELIGWIACGCSLLGAALASSYTRKIVFWGWISFLVANLFWLAYAASHALLPLLAYNFARAIINMRGARNNTWKRKQAIRAQRRKQDAQRS